MNFLSLDIGTTCAKCQVFSDKGKILFYRAKEYGLKKVGDDLYVDVDALRLTLKEIISQASKAEEFASISVSSFGESFVMLDANDEILFYPILYTDPRGDEQAKALSRLIDKNEYYETTGTLPNSLFSISKLLYIKENYPQLYARADKVLLIGDYVNYLLTGKRVIDYSLAARTAVFDIRKKKFAKNILDKVGVSEKLFSTPMPAMTVIGNVSRLAQEEFSLDASVKVILGVHDQICASVGAGVTKCGEASDGMGTVECITAVFNEPPKDIAYAQMGYGVIPFVNDLYCTYIVNYSSGALINWYKNEIMHSYSNGAEDFFEYIDTKVADKPTDVYCLPYFSGVVSPYTDINAKGAFIGLDLLTSDGDVYRSILEGLSYEMRVNLSAVKKFGINVKSVVATGGGSRSSKWMQIKSNITGLKVRTLKSHEGGLCGIAMLQAVAMGVAKDLDEAKKIFTAYSKRYAPKKEEKKVYDEKYKKYRKIYKTIKEFY